MGKNLLQFLFGESQADEELSSLVEDIADMDTDGADRLKVNKQPLEKALDALDIDTEGLEQDPRGLSLVFSDGDAARAAHAILNTPDSMHKLAELGWVFSVQGDVAMANEPAQFRIRFLEITDVEPSEEKPKPIKGTAKNTKLSAVIKKGQEFASAKPEHDDQNPVQFDDKTGSNRRKGLSKEKDGAQPEGKPKGELSGQTSGGAAKKGDLTQPEEGKAPGKLKESTHKPTCESCNIMVVNGVPTHEEGCPNSKKTFKYGRYQDEEEEEESVEEAQLDERGAHKSGCKCGFCKNKGNIHKRGEKPVDQDDGGSSTENTEEGTDYNTESADNIVDRLLAGEKIEEMNPGNPGTPPGITGHKSFSKLKVGSPDRKFAPAKGMVQPDNVEVNKQAKRKVNGG